jgi:hypothetical protein
MRRRRRKMSRRRGRGRRREGEGRGGVRRWRGWDVALKRTARSKSTKEIIMAYEANQTIVRVEGGEVGG